jgi:hypothetical protein
MGEKNVPNGAKFWLVTNEVQHRRMIINEKGSPRNQQHY